MYLRQAYLCQKYPYQSIKLLILSLYTKFISIKQNLLSWTDL